MGRERALAIGAVLLLLVPALGIATPIVVPPVPEQLIEGHTVFALIETYARTQTNETRFAAAVAVLVREYVAERRVERFPGVTWFNDQYLVDPVQRDDDFAAYRYPCGGAVLAVNAGDPDPRIVIARINASSVLPGASITEGHDEWTYTDPPFSKPEPGTYEYENDFAWLDANTSDMSVHSDTMTGMLLRRRNAEGQPQYIESYQITDPNDHSWIIDKYRFYSRDALTLSTLPPGVARSESYSYPVWVVNMLGSPVFLPDHGYAMRFGNDELVGENCMPFRDVLDETLAPVSAATCGRTSLPDGAPPFTDDPCMGYQEPSRNGYCYGGQDASAGCARDERPLRLYNALLYFKLQDLYVWDDPRDHSDPFTGTDTNGCSEEATSGGVVVGGPATSSSDWPCPNGDDDAEGNSHPFHPTTPTHAHPSPCRREFSGPNAANHGGSTSIQPTDQVEDGWYQVNAPCDFRHATRNIDLYFSGGGRPFPPLTRSYDENDREGSGAPFHDHHRAYP